MVSYTRIALLFALSIEKGSAQVGPWDITFDNLSTDFSATSDKEVKLTYVIGAGRDFVAPTLLDDDCTSPVSGGAIIAQAIPVRTPDAPLVVSEYQTINGNGGRNWADDAYPGTNTGYAPLSGGVGDLTDSIVDTSEVYSNTQYPKYVGWDFRDAAVIAADPDAAIPITFFFSESQTITRFKVSVYENPTAISAPGKVKVAGIEYDFPANPSGTNSAPYTGTILLNAPIVVAGGTGGGLEVKFIQNDVRVCGTESCPFLLLSEVQFFGAPLPLVVSEYQMINGNVGRSWADDAYPGTNAGILYAPLSGGVGDLTDSIIASGGNTDAASQPKYVGWDFRDAAVITAGDPDAAVPITFFFSEDKTITSLKVSTDENPTAISAPGKVKVAGIEYDFPANPSGTYSSYTGTILLNAPIVVAGGTGLEVKFIQNDVRVCGTESCPFLLLSEVQFFGPAYDTLTLEYDFDKATIGGSSVYEASSRVLRVCQVLQLVEQGMVIEEEKRVVTIVFELGVNFVILGQDLQVAASVQPVIGIADVQSYVEAYKCDAASSENSNPIGPNEDLYVCVRSTSADVEIDSLDRMQIGGPNVAGTADASLPVINAGTIIFPAFTSAEAVSNTERRVKTRVPASVFGYKIPGASITIFGSATMKFASSGRELRVMVDTTLFEGSSNEDPANAKFELNVGLQPAAVKINEINSSTNAVASVGVKGSIVIGLVIAFVNAIW